MAGQGLDPKVVVGGDRDPGAEGMEGRDANRCAARVDEVRSLFA